MIRIVQPDIEQAAKWNPALAGHVTKQIRMSLEGPDLTRVFGRQGSYSLGRNLGAFRLPLRVLRAGARQAKMIVGALAGPRSQAQPVYNAAFVLSDHGDVEAVYDKIGSLGGICLCGRCSRFGAGKTGAGPGDFSGLGPARSRSRSSSVSILICEIIFPTA